MSYSQFQKAYGHLVNSPIEQTGVIMNDKDEVIATVLSHSICRLLGGSDLDRITLLTGKYGRIIRASYSDDSDEDEEF
ncbi:hypothetical protein [Marinicella gelatinilytica]|uniref:hypothetical protein n=1 Tax=Marinicella gelatinilytica TaxID=2996017 RepID=UPI002260D82E|nr:hypothetical protein [Marinicella gelatinilytica]MCX7544160.1 hypothetical protein [Marinicella gelatinilytica]